MDKKTLQKIEACLNAELLICQGRIDDCKDDNFDYLQGRKHQLSDIIVLIGAMLFNAE